MSRRNLAALALVGIVVVSSVAIIILSNNQTEQADLGPGVSDVDDEIIQYDGSLTASVNITRQDFFKGESIPFDLLVNVEASPARLDGITIEVMDLNLSRSANQTIPIDILVNPGAHTIPLELSPGFDQNGFVAIVNKNYTLTGYQLNYTQIQKKQSTGGDLNYNLYGKLYPVYDQAVGMIWDVLQESNATVTVNSNNVTLISTDENATATIQTEIETTAFTRMYYNVSGQTNSSIQIG
ncbi:MAG: hypothetical protein ACC656_06160, partial [Candidatus Heimdallarchaeota archaeon]